MTGHTIPTVPDGRKTIEGRDYIGDGKGGWVPVELVKAEHLLEDEVVRKIVSYAIDLSGQVARFKTHTFEDLGAFEALLSQEYDLTKGGVKGNKTFMSQDGLFRVQVQVADHIDFGPQLQIAKALIDECLNEWAADSRPEIRAIVTKAFNTDKSGQVNRAEIFMVKRLEIDDPRWRQAVDAIDAAIRVVGSKTYVRCYQRPRFDAPWEAITIDLAKA